MRSPCPWLSAMGLAHRRLAAARWQADAWWTCRVKTVLSAHRHCAAPPSHRPQPARASVARQYRAASRSPLDRKRVGEGKSVTVSVDFGGGRATKKTK